MSPRLPSMQALRALDAFARHGTVWQAADELHLTRSAVSHQLRLLERELPFPLMEREGSSIALTQQGRAYAADVARALADLAGAGARRTQGEVAGNLTMSCTPGFGTAWLAPRIGRLAARHPGLALTLVTPRRLDDVGHPGVDLFLAFARLGGSGRIGGLPARFLAEIGFTPLLAPALLGRARATPEEITALPLLHLGGRGEWARWCEIAGVPAPEAPGIVLDDINLTVAAALAGQGVMLGDTFSCGALLAEGRLAAPSGVVLPSGHGYALVVPEGRAAGSAALRACLDWLEEELAASASASLSGAALPR